MQVQGRGGGRAGARRKSFVAARRVVPRSQSAGVTESSPVSACLKFATINSNRPDALAATRLSALCSSLRIADQVEPFTAHGDIR